MKAELQYFAITNVSRRANHTAPAQADIKVSTARFVPMQ